MKSISNKLVKVLVVFSLVLSVGTSVYAYSGNYSLNSYNNSYSSKSAQLWYPNKTSVNVSATQTAKSSSVDVSFYYVVENWPDSCIKTLSGVTQSASQTGVPTSGTAGHYYVASRVSGSPTGTASVN